MPYVETNHACCQSGVGMEWHGGMHGMRSRNGVPLLLPRMAAVCLGHGIGRGKA